MFEGRNRAGHVLDVEEAHDNKKTTSVIWSTYTASKQLVYFCMALHLRSITILLSHVLQLIVIFKHMRLDPVIDLCNQTAHKSVVEFPEIVFPRKV